MNTIRKLTPENIERVECCSTHCERTQECRDPHDCCGNAMGKAMAALERAKRKLRR